MHAQTGLLLSCIALCSTQPLLAQGTAADYGRAAQLRQRVVGKVLNDRINVRWLADGERCWYRTKDAGGAWRFVFVNVKDGTRTQAFDHKTMAAALSAALKRRISADDLPIQAIDIDSNGLVHVSAAGRTMTFNPKSGSARERAKKLPKPLSSRRPSRRGVRQQDAQAGELSPNGQWSVSLRDGAILAQRENGEDQIRFKASGTLEGGSVYWAPDSKRFVVLQIEPGQKRTVHMVESSPKGQVQPRLKWHQYLKPGDKIAISKPRLFDITKRREIPIEQALFHRPWRISRLRWAADSSRFTFIYNQRGHQALRIVSVHAEDGAATSLIEEAPDTFVDYSNKHFAYFLDERSEIVWMSERDGWNHLYRFDMKTGKQINQITNGKWVVRGVDRIDAENELIWFRACGIDADQDPYHIHHCRIKFDGTGLVRLTNADGTHELAYSPDGRFYIDRYSRVDLPPVHELRRSTDGHLVTTLESADITQLLEINGWRLPERFVAKGRDGRTDIWGIIHRPTGMNESRKYPVVEKIYAGPHSHHVPKSFNEYYTAQQIAELGFIVVQIDGMGTNWRSKQFHDVCWKNLKDAGLPDRIRWIQAAAKKYPYMDTTRVGIYGGSAGGQNALGALLFHPDFYDVAVADCGCHDNRMDKIWWNEAWMGELGPHYADNSNVTHAGRLRGKLLLTVGELDTNVDPASTMQVVDALIKADKDFDLIVVPGAGHGVGERPYLVRRRQDFFVRHLHGVEPRRIK